MSVSNAPRVRIAPPRVESTYGDLAGDLAASYGLAPDPWQQEVLNDWLAETDSQWASLTCGLSVPRQNGKNGALEIRELFGAVGRGEKILHTAHQVKTAQKHFRRLKAFFGRRVNDPAAPFPELNAMVSELRAVNGQESIFFHNGGSIELVARSQGSGRGYTVDVIVCDEAQDMSDDDLEALLSTSSSSPLGNPQWIFTGTPPGPKANGEVFTRVRDDALNGSGERICWHEWSCEKGVDLDDPEEWQKANPALGIRLQLDVVKGERARFSESGFARERLGVWTERPKTAQVISKAAWESQVNVGPPQGRAPTVLAVDASHDRIVAVAACWQEQHSAHVELIELGFAGDPLVIVNRISQRAGRRIPVVIDRASPASSLLALLDSMRVKTIQTNATDMAKACGLFYDEVLAGRLTHAGQAQLTDALAGARRRNIGDAGGWGWDRKNPEANIAPLVAATLARFGASTVRRQRTRGTGRKVVTG